MRDCTFNSYLCLLQITCSNHIAAIAGETFYCLPEMHEARLCPRATAAENMFHDAKNVKNAKQRLRCNGFVTNENVSYENEHSC